MKYLITLIAFSLATFAFAQVHDVERSDVLYVHAQSGLKLRETPGSDGKLITSMPYGAKVKFINWTNSSLKVKDFGGYEFSEGWVEIEYKGKRGYAFKGYLSALKPILSDQKNYWIRQYIEENYTLVYTTNFNFDGKKENGKSCHRWEYYKEGLLRESNTCSSESWTFRYHFPNMQMREVALLMMKLLSLKDHPLHVEYNAETNQIFIEGELEYYTIMTVHGLGVMLIADFG
ncbi:MAG: SH3 domain-containing protein [Bacteroidia bacterium]|nr:SH3 domain-containing protein [Bacteroidia bacterium]